MDKAELERLLSIAVKAAQHACCEILDVYNSSDFSVELKDNQSPLTRADKRAHDCIVHSLSDTGIPVLSEEGQDVPYEIRRSWDYVWIVDPLDGTKEFIKRNGEFTVNIALIKNGVPLMGVVAVPVTNEIFYGGKDIGASLDSDGKVTKLAVPASLDFTQDGLRVVASRSHMNEETQKFIAALKKPSLISSGSSLKFMLIAAGKADVYPRFAPTMEWDTAAAHAVLAGLNIKVLQQGTDHELVYNKPDLLNPWFIVHP